VIWTDNRNGQSDIYGAASNYGPWTNVPIVNKSSNQSSPAIAAEPSGTILHLLWVDDSSGNKDIYYAQTNGLPGSPLTGVSIIDDTTSAEQVDPVIITTFDMRGSVDVFACWQDNRHLGSSKDSDIYFAELSSGFTGTNIFVEDNGTNSNQKEPAMGVDSYGQPYLVWTDDRTGYDQIYYAGSNYVEPQPFKSENILASSGATIGTAPEAINDIDDVSVIVPPNACAFDVTITISKIRNPPAFAVKCLSAFDFGPSGIEFLQPVTITIPYQVSESGGTAAPCWYNSLTASLSQQGITDIQDIKITDTLHALSFKTTHFTPFYIISGDEDEEDDKIIESTGGGGCSISATADNNIIEFLIPYIGLGIAMAILKLRDARNRKNIQI
jgi:hypothetical protein